jgi:DNA-binding transcriptional ArsR family regulator
MRGPASVNELAEPFKVSQQAISKHLAYLERAKLIKKHKDGRQNICELNAEPFRQVDSWVSKYRTFWEGAIDRLDEFLSEMKSEKHVTERKRNAKAKK